MNNQEIIENYYCTHRSELVAFVSARIGSSEAAEDIVQDTFYRLLTGQRPLCEATLPSLAYTFCKNMVTDWYRRHSVRQDAEHELNRQGSLGYSAESLLSVHEITEQMERGLARLPEGCREPFRLSVYGGMKVSDISLETGEKYKTIENRLGQARKYIRNYLRKIS